MPKPTKAEAFRHLLPDLGEETRTAHLYDYKVRIDIVNGPRGPIKRVNRVDLRSDNKYQFLGPEQAVERRKEAPKDQ